MLILSRKADESIVIGDEVVITILSVKGKQVRVGINAPPEVSVHREEIYQRIQSGEIDTVSVSHGGSANSTLRSSEGSSENGLEIDPQTDPQTDREHRSEDASGSSGDDIGNQLHADSTGGHPGSSSLEEGPEELDADDNAGNH